MSVERMCWLYVFARGCINCYLKMSFRACDNTNGTVKVQPNFHRVCGKSFLEWIDKHKKITLGKKRKNKTKKQNKKNKQTNKQTYKITNRQKTINQPTNKTKQNNTIQHNNKTKTKTKQKTLSTTKPKTVTPPYTCCLNDCPISGEVPPFCFVFHFYERWKNNCSGVTSEKKSILKWRQKP